MVRCSCWVTDCGRQRSKVKKLLLQGCALRKFHVTDGQNTRDQITSDRMSNRAWSNCVTYMPFILSGSPNECCLHTCDACVITTWRLGLRALLNARNNNNYYNYTNNDSEYMKTMKYPSVLSVYKNTVVNGVRHVPVAKAWSRIGWSEYEIRINRVFGYEIAFCIGLKSLSNTR